MVAPSVFLTPNMMQAVLIYAFAAAVLGGLESPVGAVIGGLASVLCSTCSAPTSSDDARAEAARRARRPACGPARAACRAVRPRGREARVRRSRRPRRLRCPPDSVVVTPFLFTHYRTFQFCSSHLSIALSGSISSPASPGRSRSVTGRSWGSAPTRRRCSSSTMAGATSGRSPSPASSPASRTRLRAARDPFRRPVPRPRDVCDPALVHRPPEALSALHRRQFGKGLPQLHAELGLAHQPVDLVLPRLLDGRAVEFALGFLIVRGRLGRSFRAVRDSEIAVNRVRRLDGGHQDRCLRDLRLLCGDRWRALCDGHELREPRHLPDRSFDPAARRNRPRRSGLVCGMVFGALFVEFIRITWGPAILDLFRRVHHIEHTRARLPTRRLRRRCSCSSSTLRRRALQDSPPVSPAGGRVSWRG